MQQSMIEFPSARPLTPKHFARIERPFMIEEKLDGERRLITSGHCYSRRVSDVSGEYENRWRDLPRFLQFIFIKNKDLVIDGELFVEGGTSSDVKTVLKEYRLNGVTPLSTRLKFTAFHLLGSNLYPHIQRERLQTRGFTVPRLLYNEEKCAPYWDENDFDYALLENEAVQRKIEGWVLKEQRMEPVWWKYKIEHTLDAIITGTKEGDGKYLGLTGALRCSIYDEEGDLVEIASISGMSDEVREDITEMEDADKLVGRVVEVRYQKVATRGRLQHPRFVRFRDDKNAKECTVGQLTNG